MLVGKRSERTMGSSPLSDTGAGASLPSGVRKAGFPALWAGRQLGLFPGIGRTGTGIFTQEFLYVESGGIPSASSRNWTICKFCFEVEELVDLYSS